MIRKGIEQFFDFDYIGAPWINAPGNEYLKEHVNTKMVGNGGFSMRSPRLMYDITQEYQKEKKTLFFHNINNIPEDVFFSKYCVVKNAALPTTEVASLFSSEEIINTSSIGFHKVWCYHQLNQVKNFFDKIIDS